MFIDTASNSITRAPAERNVSVIGTWRPNYVFAPMERGNFLRGRAFYKHLAPNGAKSNNVLFTFRVGASGVASRWLVHPMVKTVNIPKSRRPDYSVAPFGSG